VIERNPDRERSRLRTGVYLALLTALISGVAVFVNKFAITGLKDPVLLSGLKNALVATAIVGAFVAARRLDEVRRLRRSQVLGLLLIGIVGGGIPFILFFKGLAMTDAVNAAFLHKTLFLWVALLAVPLLGERLGRWQLAAIGVLLAGSTYLLLPRGWNPGAGDLLVLAATWLWAIEAILARKILVGGVSAQLGAGARMTVGSVVILTYLGATGALGGVGALGGMGVVWLLVTAVFLIGYVLSWYAALKHAPAAIVTSVLVLGYPITAVLSALRAGSIPETTTLAGLGLVAVAVAALVIATLRRPEVRRA
jgi:drug/metabolite transporter (DMT)-like permease